MFVIIVYRVWAKIVQIYFFFLPTQNDSLYFYLTKSVVRPIMRGGVGNSRKYRDVANGTERYSLILGLFFFWGVQYA